MGEAGVKAASQSDPGRLCSCAEATANEFRSLMHFVASETAAFLDHCFEYAFPGIIPILILLIAKYAYCVKIMSRSLL